MTEVAQSGRLRLLVLASTYPRWPGDHEPGFVHELAKRLVGEFDVTVLCPHATGSQRLEQMDGVSVHRFRYAPDRFESLVNDGGMVGNLKRSRWKWLLVPLFFIAQALAARKIVRSWKPAVIHVHWLVPQGLVIAMLDILSWRLPPFVVTSHGADLFALRARPMLALKRLVLRRAAASTVVSRAMVEKLRELGAGPEKISVMPMGVDLRGRFVPDAAVVRSERELLFVGRLVEKKGLRYLIEAMPAILDRYPDARLSIVGFGPEREVLELLASRLGVTANVDFMGAVTQDRLPGLYRRATAFVAPFIEAASGDQEGLGLVMAEAAGCGCPVLASDLPATRDVVSDPMPPADSIAIAKRVCELLALSPAERDQHALALRDRLLPRLDWQPVADGYAGLLRSVAQNGN